MTKIEQLMDEAIEIFKNDDDLFIDCIEELDDYSGYLNYDRYLCMDDLNELCRDTEPRELLSRAFFGFDEDTYTTDSNGNRTYGAFNPNRKYYGYSAYGNLVSSDHKDYSELLDHYFISALAEDLPKLSEPGRNERLLGILTIIRED